MSPVLADASSTVGLVIILGVKRLRSDWSPPYGMGRWAPGVFSE